MSLKVWLPLNGDLRNLGTSNAIITNSSAIVNTTGKIGSCYSFAKNAYLDVNKEIMQNFNNAVSICFWIKINSWNTNWDTIFQAGKGSTAWTQYHIGILRNSANYLCWTLGDGSTVSNANYKTGNITLGEWTHVTCTYGEGKWATYLNGILSNSGTTTIIPNFSNITSIKIGGLAGAYKCDCLMNDFRIYDHALSAAEVKEIAQGLVLHYKLDSEYNENTTNLAAGVIGYDYVSKDVAQYATSLQGKTFYGNKIFTYSAYIKNTSDNPLAVRFNPYNAADTSYSAFNGNYIQPGQEGRSIVTVDITDTSKWNGKVILYIQNGNSGTVPTNKTFYIKEVQVEEKNHATPFTPNTRNNTIIQDSSGYGYNGEIISELHISNDSARYKNSTLFDGVDDCIIVPYNTVCPENIFTINLWFKKDALGSKNYETLFGGPGGFEMDTRSGSATSLSLYMASTRSGNRATGITMNEWHMITMTRDGTTEKYYVDGEFKSEIEAKPMPNGIYRIGAWASNTGQNYYGLISDFRIYATALLDADIKKLYNTSMSIDNNQNIYSFELIEQSTNLFSAIPWTSPYSIHALSSSLFSNFNEYGEPQFTTNGSSAGSNYIIITPGIYEYDYTVSINAGNQFYIGLERYDKDKTSRSNNATTYIYATKPSSDVVKQRYKGTVNLSTDGTNPIRYIALRILNGWSGTTSGVTGQAIIHNFSLRLQSSASNPQITKTGQFIVSELKQDMKASFYKDHIVEAAEFIER